MAILQTKNDGYWEFRSGALGDLSGNGNDGTFTSTPYFNNAGLVFDGIDDKVGIGNTSTTIKTLAIVLNPKSTTEDIADMDGGTHTLEVGAGTITATGWDTPSIYVDGVVSSALVADRLQTIVVTTATGFSASNLDIGTETTFFGGTIAAAFISTSELTSSEVAQLTSELNSVTLPTKPKSKKVRNLKPSLSQDNPPIAALDMKPSQGQITDITGAGNDGTIIGQPVHENTIIGNALNYATGNSIDMSDPGLPAAFSVVLWHYPKSRGEANFGRFWDKGTNNFMMFINNSDTDLRLQYHNGVAGGNIWDIVNGYALNQWNCSIITSSGSEANWYLNDELIDTLSSNIALVANNINIGNNAAYNRTYDGLIASPQVYDRVLTADERSQIYQQGASAIQYKTDWGTKTSHANVSTGQLEDTDWQVSTGAWIVTTDVLNQGIAKVFENITAGVLYLPIDAFMTESDAAYGTWQFYMYKGADTNVATISIIDNDLTVNNAGGYGFRFMNDERIQMIEWGVAEKFNTAASYISINTWYGIKITRSSTGIFNAYIKGDSFGNDWVLIDPSGGDGTNPFTDNTRIVSNFIVVDFDAGDKLAIADPKGDHSFIKTLGII